MFCEVKDGPWGCLAGFRAGFRGGGGGGVVQSLIGFGVEEGFWDRVGAARRDFVVLLAGLLGTSKPETLDPTWTPQVPLLWA